MSHKYKVGDKIKSRDYPHHIAKVTAIRKGEMDYTLDKPVGFPIWSRWVRGTCLEDGFVNWEVLT